MQKRDRRKDALRFTALAMWLEIINFVDRHKGTVSQRVWRGKQQNVQGGDSRDLTTQTTGKMRNLPSHSEGWPTAARHPNP